MAVRTRVLALACLLLLPLAPAVFAFDPVHCGAGFPTGAPTATVQVTGPFASGSWTGPVATKRAFARAWIDAEVTEHVGFEKAEFAWRAFSDLDSDRRYGAVQTGDRDIVHASSPWDAEALCWRLEQVSAWTIRDLQVSLSLTRASNATLAVWVT